MSKSLIPTDNQLTISNLGEIFVRSGYFADARDAAQAVVKILAGQELGLPPIASMTGINIIKGKVSLSAVAMATVLKRHGKYDYRVRENTNDACEIEFFYDTESIGKSQFSMKDAERAGIFKANPSYKKYPRNMLFARAMSNGIRWYCPDVLGGPAYTPGELDTGIDSSSDESNVIDIQSEEIDEFVKSLEVEDKAKAKVKAMFEDGIKPPMILAEIGSDFTLPQVIKIIGE